MLVNPSNQSIIVRVQAEYRAASQAMSVRYLLEIPSSGEHRGFADVEDLISALRIELRKSSEPIVASQRKEEKPENQE
jgi:hypothetical protein